MLAKELAEMLMEYPDSEVTVSVDISKHEKDWERRAFGEIIEVMNDQRTLVLICVGDTNEEVSTMGRRKTEQEKEVRRAANHHKGRGARRSGGIMRSRTGAVVRTVEDSPVVVAGANSMAKPHVQFDGIGVDVAEEQSVAVGQQVDLDDR